MSAHKPVRTINQVFEEFLADQETGTLLRYILLV
jgi:hypothetical protein